MRILTVYVPARASHLRTEILPGSGIVGGPIQGPEDRILIDYEGNQYGAVNIVTFEDKLLHAAGRHIEMYPTIARQYILAEELIEVGTYDYPLKRLVVTNQSELDAWLGVKYTWHPDRDGFGTLLEAEKSGVGTFAEGYTVVSNSIRYDDAVARFGAVTRYDTPIPITITVEDDEAP